MMYSITEYSKSNPGAKKVFLLDKPEILIGRNQTAHVPILDRGVSRRHALLKLINDKWSIIDCGSANGVYVGNNKVNPETPHELKEGDRFYLSEPSLTGRSFLFGRVLGTSNISQHDTSETSLPQVDHSPLPNPENVISPVSTMPVKRTISLIRKSTAKRGGNDSSYCEDSSESSSKENNPLLSGKKTSRRKSLRLNTLKRQLQNSLILEDNVESPRKKKLTEEEYMKLQLELEEKNQEIEQKKEEIAKIKEQLERLKSQQTSEKERTKLQEIGVQADDGIDEEEIKRTEEQTNALAKEKSNIIAELEETKKELEELRQKAPCGITADDLSCSICFNPMINAIILDCGHSFCELCIKVWRNQSQTNSCPYCRKEFVSTRPLHLINNLVQKYFSNLSPEKRKEWERVAQDHEVQISVMKVADMAESNTISGGIEDLPDSQRNQLRRSYALSVIELIRNPHADISPDRFFAFPLNVRLQVLQHLSTFREYLTLPNPSPEDLERFGASIMTP